ncbi:MAG: alpha-2-macroglobulin family protein [Patescibacteria group bacterium]
MSSRNIFKNTAFYKADIITDENGKAQINFELPDNVTNFRIMAVAQSKDNYFGSSQEFISVRKNILIEEKMPLISRTKDEIVVGANIFNLTNNKQDLEVSFESQ